MLLRGAKDDRAGQGRAGQCTIREGRILDPGEYMIAAFGSRATQPGHLRGGVGMGGGKEGGGAWRHTTTSCHAAAAWPACCSLDSLLLEGFQLNDAGRCTHRKVC